MVEELKQWVSKNLQGDSVIWIIIIFLSFFSMALVYSTTSTLAYRRMDGNTEYYMIKHGALVILSLLVTWYFHQINFRYFSKVCRILLWFSVPLLLLTYNYGLQINEASRWISIPIINQAFQPSDLAKLSLIVTVAYMLTKSQEKIHDIQNVIMPMIFWIGLICMLIAFSNISSGVLLFMTCMLMLFIGRVPLKFLISLFLIGALVGTVALSFGERKGTAISRITGYFNEEIPFQAQQAYIAIASGGIVGNGPGKSVQKNYLPHSYSDFIYAIIIEEYGFIGGVLILVLYLILLYRSVSIFYYSNSTFGGFLTIGLMTSVVLQALVNMSVAVGLGPITGLPLPFLSMGGTSQIFVGISMGVILSISKEVNEKNKISNSTKSESSYFPNIKNYNKLNEI